MHLLLIEDDAEAARFLAKGLRESGYVVDIAADGREGLFRATEGTYDLIIADRQLPHFDGLSIVAMLRKNCTGFNTLTASLPDASAFTVRSPLTRVSVRRMRGPRPTTWKRPQGSGARLWDIRRASAMPKASMSTSRSGRASRALSCRRSPMTRACISISRPTASPRVTLRSR